MEVNNMAVTAGAVAQVRRNIEQLASHGSFGGAHAALLGSTGSRLLSGDSGLHHELELLLAKFHGAPSATLLSSGYDANLGLLACLPFPNDAVIYDELIHNSLHVRRRAGHHWPIAGPADAVAPSPLLSNSPFQDSDLALSPRVRALPVDQMGIRLGRQRHSRPFAHNCSASLRERLSEAQQDGVERSFVVLESLYSMDGDLAPLGDMLAVAAEFEAAVVVDEVSTPFPLPC